MTCVDTSSQDFPHKTEDLPRDRFIAFAVFMASLGIVFLVFLALVGGFQVSLLTPLVDYQGVVTMRYFDIQGQSLLQGRLDVPCDSLQAEAFTIDGKCYGYYGLFPTFIRMPLNALFPGHEGLWPRLMMIAGGLLTYGGCLALAFRGLDKNSSRSRRWIGASLFSLFAALGTTLVFIVSGPYPYHELILWASAFALWAFWGAGRYVDTGATRFLWLCVLFAGAAVHARFTVGFGVILGLIYWFSAPFLRATSLGKLLFCPNALGRSRRLAGSAIVVLAIVAATPMAVNYAKFGQLSLPYTKQIWYQNFPGRLKKIQGGIFRLENLNCSAALYLSPNNINVGAKFPLVNPGQPHYWFAPPYDEVGLLKTLSPAARPCVNSYVESLDPSFSILYGAPVLVVLGLWGLYALVRRPKELWARWSPVLAGGGLALIPTMFYSSVNYRYEHDFFPFLIVASILGWAQASALEPSRKKRLVFLILVLCAVVGAWVNFIAAQTSGSPQPYIRELGEAVAGFFR